MISVTSVGDLKKTISFLNNLSNKNLSVDLNRYGKLGVDALAKFTPVDSNLTANSWGYRIIKSTRGPGIEWYNTNVVNGTPVAILIQYGHATGGGGHVVGRDYINPAIRPIFDKISEEIGKKVR